MFALLGNYLRWFFLGVFDFAFKKLFAKYAAAIVALGFIIAAMVTLIIAYLNTMFQVIDAVRMTIPQTAQLVWGWVMPGNAVPCLLALLFARSMAWFTKLGYEVLKIKSKPVT